jgi:membrane associated rhomboid family serine protease
VAWIIRLPALVVIGVWILLQLFSEVGSISSSTGGVAYMAHIGGFIAGLILTFFFRGRQRTLPPTNWSA